MRGNTADIELRRLTPDEWPLWRSIRLDALSEAPYAFVSTLADWQGVGDSKDRWRSRLMDVSFNVVAVLDGSGVGQVSATHLDEFLSVELISMWVSPQARGRGVGDALIDAVLGWAADCGADSVSLAVKSTNQHAIALYERTGFVAQGKNPGAPDERRMQMRIPHI